MGEPLGGFYNVDLHFIIVILHLSICFIPIFFPASSLTLPWTIVRFLDPFCTFSLAHGRVIRYTSIFNHSVIFLKRALRFWVGIFYPQARFTLRSFLTFLAQSAFIKVSMGAGSYFLESCRGSFWSLKHRHGLSVCLIHSNPQSFIQLNFAFIRVNIAKCLLVAKTLIKSAATLFSSHKNRKQQPN